MSVKEDAHELIDRLIGKITWDDLLRAILLHIDLDKGIEDARAGRLIPMETVMKHLKEASKVKIPKSNRLYFRCPLCTGENEFEFPPYFETKSEKKCKQCKKKLAIKQGRVYVAGELAVYEAERDKIFRSK